VSSLGNRLYTGETSIDIVGRSKRWYLISAILLAIALGSLLFRGLNFSIEFTGGAEFRTTVESAEQSTVDDVAGAVVGTGIEGASSPRVTIVGGEDIRVQTGDLTTDESNQVRDAIAETVGVDSDTIASQIVGPSWGGEITRQALWGLSLFLAGVVIYLAIAFEWKLSLAALAALLHDIVFTVGIYSLVGFDVSPATLIGFLTILGYSLYDTVVVFDKLRENTRGITAQNKRTYAEMANLAVNQTIMRSINTSVIALLPIGSILFVGAGLLGAGTLKDLALALFIGVAVGTYSSIFLAAPVAVDLKSREPAIRALQRRVVARRSGSAGGRAAEASVSGTTATATATMTKRLDDDDDLHGAVIETGDRNQPQRKTRSQRKSSGGGK
jgi:preprotein translocase subunit SecF